MMTTKQVNAELKAAKKALNIATKRLAKMNQDEFENAAALTAEYAALTWKVELLSLHA